MSTYDLYADGFPHSTPAGHEQGCRGAACPGKLDNGYSCSEAAIRYNGDFTYRRLVDSGKTPQEITALAAEIAKPKREIVSTPERPVAAPARPKAPSKPLTAQPVFEATKADEVAPIVTYTADGKAVTHGTPNGYQKGCRNEDLCPNVAIGLTSCVQGKREYQRARRNQIRDEQEVRRGTRIEPAPRPDADDVLKQVLRDAKAHQPIAEPEAEKAAGGFIGEGVWDSLPPSYDRTKLHEGMRGLGQLSLGPSTTITGGEVVVTVKTLPDGSSEIRIQVPAGPAPRIVS